ncbi:unnamed protein product [Trichobilharzia szidati]|nr:unnamed protein product [Trichobilharzia szidati]
MVAQFIFKPEEASLSMKSMNTHVKQPNCLKWPLKVEDLQQCKHLCLFGYVFDVSNDQKFSGMDGIYTNLTGHCDMYKFVGETKRYGLDGLTIAQISDLSQQFQEVINNYACIGYVPGIYLDPMGEPMAYFQEIMHTWDVIVKENEKIFSLFPKCELRSVGDQVYGYCEDKRSNNPLEFTTPKQLNHPNFLKPPCVCVTHRRSDNLESLFNFQDYHDCQSKNECLLNPI